MTTDTETGRRALRALTDRGLLRRWPGLLIASGEGRGDRWRFVGGAWWVSDLVVMVHESAPPASLTLALAEGWVVVEDEASMGVLRAAARLLWGIPGLSPMHAGPDIGRGWLLPVTLPGGIEGIGGMSEAEVLVKGIESAPVQP